MNPLNHIDYTVAAVELFGCLDGQYAKPDVRAILAGSSAAEDSLKPLSLDFQRIFNWHFYNNGGHIGDNPLIPGTRTSEKRVQHLITELDEEIAAYSANGGAKNARSLLDTAGRLMHHIQDMSTPSHVVPVYHGPGLADQYEKYGKAYARRLSVQSGEESDNRLMVSITGEEVMRAAKQLQGAHSPLFNLYVNAAEATLEKLRAETLEIYLDGMAQRRTWNAFWREHTSADAQCPNGYGIMKNLADGFGSFGPLCNNFGRIHFETAEGFYEISSDQYLEFFKELFRKSAIDSLLVLRNIAQRCGVLTYDHRLVHVD